MPTHTCGGWKSETHYCKFKTAISKNKKEIHTYEYFLSL